MSNIYYQPDFKNDAVIKTIDGTELSSFHVYLNYETAKTDFPDRQIIAYSGDDIEDPEFVDSEDCVKLTEQQKEKYLNNPSTCPFCDGIHFECGSLEIDGKIAWQEIVCGECGELWHDEYKLFNIETEIY